VRKQKKRNVERYSIGDWVVTVSFKSAHESHQKAGMFFSGRAGRVGGFYT
jgi:hypothetical protein